MGRRWSLVMLGLALAACGTPTPGGVELVPAAAGDAAGVVAAELTRARRDGRQLLVYVGASWCGPCRRFHAAVAAHKLDAQLPRVRLVEFDADRDGERLATAGYLSRLIPLFARPNADGRPSGRQIEGSIRADGPVDEIVPRLRALLAP